MLHKCANPACCAQFLYLHLGRLFEVETQYFESSSGDGQGRLCSRKTHIELFWLCDQCSAHSALRFDQGRGLVMVSLPGSEDAVTTVLPIMPEERRRHSKGFGSSTCSVRELPLWETASQLNVERRETV